MSRQTLDCVVFPWADPPGSALAANQNIPQQPSLEGGVSSSTQDPGGCLITSVVAGNERQPAVSKCADCLSCPDLSQSLEVKSNITRKNYSSINLNLTKFIVKLGTIFIFLPTKIVVYNMLVKV